MNKNRLNCFKDFISLDLSLPYSILDKSQKIVESTYDNSEIIEMLWKLSGGEKLMSSNKEGVRRPIILSSEIGLVWAVVFGVEGDDFHIIGPVYITDINTRNIEKYVSDSDVPIYNKRSLLGVLNEIPIMRFDMLHQYILMCHFAVNDEKIKWSEIKYSNRPMTVSDTFVENKNVKSDRRKTWAAEQQLLKNVKEGNLNYQKAYGVATAFSKGLGIKIGNPVRYSKDSVLVFTALCTRAAIEGGLSPDYAYTLGDFYSENVEGCMNIAEVGNLSRTMYSDFIQRVNDVKYRGQYSKTIQSVCDYISRNLDKEIKVEDLAEYIGYSKYYLTRKFTNEMGESISNYIRKMRIERAKLLLSSGTLSIFEISESLHFCSRSYFSDVFKKMTGMSPAAYREENKIL